MQKNKLYYYKNNAHLQRKLICKKHAVNQYDKNIVNQNR